MDRRSVSEERLTLSDISRERPKAVEREDMVPGQDDGTLGMKVENLSAFYGSFKALTDINIGIQANKVTALIGRRAAARAPSSGV